MSQNRNPISLAITVYNRPDMVVESFCKVHEDPRVSEIIISDDNSSMENYSRMIGNLDRFRKVKVLCNKINLGVYENKKKSVEMCKTEWCIVFDSDNIIDVDYLDAIFEQNWDNWMSLAPAFAKPNFDYRRFESLICNKINIKPYLHLKGFDCLLNTMNFFINRQSFLNVWKPWEHGRLGADSIHYNRLWLEAGNSIRVVPGLEYFHRLHPRENKPDSHGSNYANFAKESEPLCRAELELIKNLK